MSKKYYFEHFVFFQILLETLAPCKSIARLPNTIFRGMSSANRNATHQTFTILPQSTTHVKIFFYGKYCMDVHMRAEGLISIRDGAYSRWFILKYGKPWSYLPQYPSPKALGCQCLLLCVFLLFVDSSKTVEPKELKFWRMIPLGCRWF